MLGEVGSAPQVSPMWLSHRWPPGWCVMKHAASPTHMTYL